jgi:photosystem II stability/assembly factor-like uncharacterized protein
MAGCIAIVLIAMIWVPTPALASNWTLRQLPPTHLEGGGTDAAPLSGISCPSESLCVAVGGFDTVASSQSPSGDASHWGVVHPTYAEPKQSCLEKGESLQFCSSPRGSLNAVSCATENLCVAVGYEGSVYTSTDPPAGAWSVTDVNGTDGGAAHLTSVSCPSVSLCVAVSGGSNNSNGGRVLTSTDPLLGEWKLTEIDGSLDFRSVSCGTPSLCVAVARGGRLFFSTDPTGGASAWRDAGAPGGPGDLEGASCVSTLLCAVGNQTGNVLTTTDPGGGSAWAETKAGGSVQITGVSCPSAADCVAVDDNGDVLTSADPAGGQAAWHFENLLPFKAEGQPLNALFSASCASASLCALVGIKGRIFTSTDPFSGPAGSGGKRQREAAQRPRTVLLWAEHFWEVSATRHLRLRARFRFYSPTQARGFECKRDRGPYRPCRSPLRYWVGHGRHALRVRAIGPSGLRGPAAIKRFRVLRPVGLIPRRPKQAPPRRGRRRDEPCPNAR